VQEHQLRILRGGGVRDRWLLLVPGQQLVQPSSRVIGNPAQHVGEPSLWIDIVELGGGDQGVHRRSPLAAAIGAGEEPVLATDGNAAQRPLGGVVGQADAGHLDVSCTGASTHACTSATSGPCCRADARRPSPEAYEQASTEPIPSKRLQRCKGEFASYSHAEQDAVIRDFRDIIINAKLTSTASAIDRKAWHELVVGRYRELLGDPMSICVLHCIDEIVRFAEPRIYGHQISIVFDQGIYSQVLKNIIEKYSLRPPMLSITFGAVQKILPLQGADIVATENYWHALQRIKQGDNALPRPHLKHFLDNMLYQALLLDREGIEMELRRRGPDGRL